MRFKYLGIIILVQLVIVMSFLPIQGDSTTQFETADVPGITGLVTTSIGKQNINIDTVSHNRHKKDKATFSVATMPCTLLQIEDAIEEINKNNKGLLVSVPKIIPILY